VTYVNRRDLRETVCTVIEWIKVAQDQVKYNEPSGSIRMVDFITRSQLPKKMIMVLVT
jgi:hypothetical protein